MTLLEVINEYHIILRSYNRRMANERLDQRVRGGGPVDGVLRYFIWNSFEDDGTPVKDDKNVLAHLYDKQMDETFKR